MLELFYRKPDIPAINNKDGVILSLTAVTKSEAIYIEIKKSISKGLLKPGDRLIIQQLAAQYGVSDIPVREALKKLTTEGYVETQPHMGSRVASMSHKGLEEVCAVREVLEPFAAKLAAQRVTNAEIKKLEEFYEKVDRALSGGRMDDYKKVHRHFHKYLVELSGNELLTKTIFDLMDMESRMRIIFQLFPDIMQESAKEHRQILEVLRNKDGEALAELIYKHKHRAFERLKLMIAEQS